MFAGWRAKRSGAVLPSPSSRSHGAGLGGSDGAVTDFSEARNLKGWGVGEKAEQPRRPETKYTARDPDDPRTREKVPSHSSSVNLPSMRLINKIRSEKTVVAVRLGRKWRPKVSRPAPVPPYHRYAPRRSASASV